MNSCFLKTANISKEKLAIFQAPNMVIMTAIIFNNYVFLLFHKKTVFKIENKVR